MIETAVLNENFGIRIRKNSTKAPDNNEIIRSCISAGASLLVASGVAKEVVANINDRITTQEIRSMIYDRLYETNPKIAEQYKHMQKYRSQLMIRTSKTTLERFERSKIVESLLKETTINHQKAEFIAREVERELGRLRLNYVTAPLIREIVNVKLLEHGLEKERASYTRLGMPVYDVKNLIERGSKENANLQYNPESVHKLMADQISKEYALINLLPIKLADAHMVGEIHIHDLDYFIRPFCFSHDIRFFLRNGFKADGVGNHTAIAGPAKRPEVAFLHAAKVLAASQTNCAGGQGFSYFNTFLAPYIPSMEYKKVRQLAQMFIYELSQMYVARGGQTVFSSIDCDMSVPEQFRDIPAVLPGGKIKDSITYSDFEDEVRLLFNAIVDVYFEGDYIGKPFNFPKFEVQIHPDDIKNGRHEDELLKVSKLAAKFGTPYYIINQPYMPKFACYQSMPWDEKILILRDDKILPIEIGRYVDDIMEREEIERANGFEGEVEISSAKDYAISFNPKTLKVEKRKIGKVMRHKTKERAFRFILDGNRTLSATEKHKIPLVRDNKVIEVRMEDLRVGDFIIGLKNLNLDIKFDSGLKFKEKYIKLDKDIARLLGYFASEGYIHVANKRNRMNKVCFSFNQSEREYIDDVSNILKNRFSLNPKFDSSKKNKTTTVYVYDKFLVELFVNELKTGLDAKTKRVPERILSAPKEILEEFLIGMFRGDAHIGKNIDLHLCNKELIDDIFLLTLRIGIPFELLPRENSYHLRLTSSLRINQFIDEIPFASINCEIPLKTFDFYDRIPVEPFNINRVEMKTGHWNRSQVGKRVTENRLELGENLFTNFISSDLHLFEVKQIEEVNSEYVYDLIDVEQNHNFANIYGIFSSNCCSFLMPLDLANTQDDVINGTLRGGGLQVVTINLPQLAYIANGDDNKLFELLRKRMRKAKDIHLLKRELINKNLKNNLLPFMNQTINENGERYLEPDKQGYIIGLVGMNELVRAHTGEEIHESDNAWTFALKVMKMMKDIVAEFRKETGFNFSLARTPAESSAYRLAQIDIEKYPGKAVFNGSGNSAYYTNSFHVRPSAEIPLWKRLTIEGAFHALTDGGAMSHVYLGESSPSPEGIHELTKRIATKTAIQYFAYTKDLSVCSRCNMTIGGLIDKCPNCGSSNIDWWSRITGYYQNVSGWNRGKISELKDRRRYGVSGSSGELSSEIKKKLQELGKNGWKSDFDF